MWKPMIDLGAVKRVAKGYAVGGAVAPPNAAQAAVTADEQERARFFAPDPNMYRSDAKNMKNVKDYIKDQGVELVGKKPTAASLLTKFQEGQFADGMGDETEQTTVQAPPPKPPEPAGRIGPSYGMNLDNSLGLSSLSAPSSGLSGVALPSISGGLGLEPMRQMARGGAVDYRKGGPVAGGPPGVDTVPAKLTNGEYVLPVPTTRAMGGKPVLDQAVLATTGKPPVGYADGGRVSGWNVNRAKQIEDAMNGAVGQVPQAAQVAPPAAAPDVQLSEGEQYALDQARAAEAAQVKKPAWKKMLGFAKGGQIDEEELARRRMQAIDPQYAVARAASVAPRYALPMSGGNLIAEPATPGIPIAATPESRMRDYRESDVARPRSMPMTASGYGSAPVTPSRPQAGYAPAVEVPARMPPAAPELYQGSIGSRILSGAGKAIAGMFPDETPEMTQDRMDRTRRPGAVVSPQATVVPSQAPALTPEEQKIMALKPQTRDIPVAHATPEANYPEQLLDSSGNWAKEAMDYANANIRARKAAGWNGELSNSMVTPELLARANTNIIGGAPAGVDEAAYAAMSPAQKSAAKVASLEQATTAIRGLRNAQREREGLPPIGQQNQGVFANLKPSEQIAYANLLRGFSKDQRDVAQDQISNRFKAEELLGSRRKELTAAQDRYMEQAAPFADQAASDFPWMQSSLVPFFQQASRVDPTDPGRAVGALATAYSMMEGSPETEPLFTVAGQPVTSAQAVAILKGEKPFDNWLRLKFAGKELYDEARRVAALKVQERALQGLGSR